MASTPAHEREATKYFVGIARVKLSSIDLNHTWARHHHRPVSQARVDGLKRIFSRQGCLRDVTKNFIVANVSARAIAAALGKVNGTENDLHAASDKAPLVIDGTWCLEGFHRIEAARQHLNPADDEQWWTVRLFQDLPERIAIGFLENAADEQPPSDGDILYKILRYRRDLKVDEEQKWWGRLSEKSQTKENDLRQLLRDEATRDLLLDLVDIPGLWPRIMLGQIHRHHSLKCDEELVNGLTHVRNYWKDNVIGTLIAPEDVDVETVDQLEQLAPAVSKVDRLQLQQLMASKSIFRTIDDLEVRRQLLERLCAKPCLIPSLRIFFENQKVLELCTVPLQNLLGGRRYLDRVSLRQSFYARYRPPAHRLIEVGDGCFAIYGQQTFESDRWVAWVSLWVFCLRNFPQLGKLNPRQEDRKHQAMHAAATPHVELELYNLAVKLGFNLPRPKLDISCTAKVGPAVHATPSLRIDGRLMRGRRYGRPFEKDYWYDQKQLFIPSFFAADSAADNSADGDISPFFVKRDIFWTFLAEDTTYRTYLGTALDADQPLEDLRPVGRTDSSPTEPLEDAASIIEQRIGQSVDEVLHPQQEQYCDTLAAENRDLNEQLQHQKTSYRELQGKASSMGAKALKAVEESENLRRLNVNQEKELQSLATEKTQLKERLEEQTVKLNELTQTVESGRKRKLDEGADIEAMKRQKKALSDSNTLLKDERDRLKQQNDELTKKYSALRKERDVLRRKNVELNTQLEAGHGEKNELSVKQRELILENTEKSAQIRQLQIDLELLKAKADVAIDQRDLQLQIQKTQLMVEASNWKEQKQEEFMNRAAQNNEQVFQIGQQALQTTQGVINASQQASQSAHETAIITMEQMCRMQLSQQELQLQLLDSAKYFVNTIAQSGQSTLEFLKSTQKSIASSGRWAMWFVYDAAQPPVPLITDDLEDFAPKLRRSLENAFRKGQHIIFRDWTGKIFPGEFEELIEIWERIHIIFAGEKTVMDQWAANGAFQGTALMIAAEVQEDANSQLKQMTETRMMIGDDTPRPNGSEEISDAVVQLQTQSIAEFEIEEEL
ncbi:hypothetical protein NA57DRAFT_72229 [Rhizodiscina lignyota]|uniref:Uncharacterized protein n=1 Tax=Rhizodiscina lignyota TaxID=1504668 RepID=A0A9P4IPY7_9PEZI|nr:hypothetical protein NA57DRAFT_72229 [Rhizodiscina lignyota]